MKKEDLEFAEKIVFYGDLAEVFKIMKINNWSRRSVQYVLNQVWYEEDN